MGFVADAVKGIGKAVFGGGGGSSTSAAYSKMSPEEQARLTSIEGELGSMLAKGSGGPMKLDPRDQNIQNLFRQHLTEFLTQEHGPNPTPEQMQQASSFIDQTFTNPARALLQQQQGDTEATLQARAASLGRNSNLDVATQQAIAGELARQGLTLEAERGARIGQQANYLNEAGFNRGLQGLQAGATGVQMGMQNTSFLNDLAQRAFANRMSVLNAKSGIANFYQQDRARNNAPQPAQAGLLGQIASGAGQIANTIGAVQGIGKSFGSFSGSGGISDSYGPTGEYTSSSNAGGIGNFRLK